MSVDADEVIKNLVEVHEVYSLERFEKEFSLITDVAILKEHRAAYLNGFLEKKNIEMGIKMKMKEEDLRNEMDEKEIKSVKSVWFMDGDGKVLEPIPMKIVSEVESGGGGVENNNQNRAANVAVNKGEKNQNADSIFVDKSNNGKFVNSFEVLSKLKRKREQEENEKGKNNTEKAEVETENGDAENGNEIEKNKGKKFVKYDDDDEQEELIKEYKKHIAAAGGDPTSEGAGDGEKLLITMLNEMNEKKTPGIVFVLTKFHWMVFVVLPKMMKFLFVHVIK